MTLQLILVSDRKEDFLFWPDVARAGGFGFHSVTDRKDLQLALKTFPSAIVLWDLNHYQVADELHPMGYTALSEMIGRSCFPQQVIAITDSPLGNYEHLFEKKPVFNHHFYRAYANPAQEMYVHLLRNLLAPYPFGLKRFFHSGLDSKRIILKRSKEKQPAVKALQNVLEKLSIRSRLASQIARATDELLMNAIFDAPQSKQLTHYKRIVQRNDDFAFGKNELISLEFMKSENYMAVSVTDQYGSFQRDVFLRLLKQNYRVDPYAPRKSDPGAGLGIYGIVQSGLSLMFISKPEARTEVCLFFPITSSYMELRQSFRFESYLSDAPPIKG